MHAMCASQGQPDMADTVAGNQRLSSCQGNGGPLHLDLNVSCLHATRRLLHHKTTRPTLHFARYTPTHPHIPRHRPSARPDHRRLRTRSSATRTGHLRPPAGAPPQPTLPRRRTQTPTRPHALARQAARPPDRQTAAMAGTRNYDFLVSLPRPHSTDTACPVAPWQPTSDHVLTSLGADQAPAYWRLGCRKVMLSLALQ